MAKIKGHVIVSANHLLTGDTIYLTRVGWSEDIHEAETAEGDAADALLARARAQAAIAVGPDFAAVTLTEDGPVPTHRREQIRRDGPTVGVLNPDLRGRHLADAQAA
jgi:hypothetical protein